MDNYFIHQLDSIWKFVLYLRDAVTRDKVLKAAYGEKRQYECPLLDRECLLPLDTSEIEVNRYYLGGSFDDVYFSKREIDCLILLYKNNSPKKQAELLGLSPRSIETYLERIKEKTHCRTQTELILKLAQNNLFKSFVNQ